MRKLGSHPDLNTTGRDAFDLLFSVMLFAISSRRAHLGPLAFEQHLAWEKRIESTVAQSDGVDTLNDSFHVPRVQG